MGGTGGMGSSLWDGLRVQDSIYGVITGGSLWEAQGAPYGRHGGRGELPMGWFESAGQYIWCDNVKWQWSEYLYLNTGWGAVIGSLKS
jgi:hypothetical protein